MLAETEGASARCWIGDEAAKKASVPVRRVMVHLRQAH